MHKVFIDITTLVEPFYSEVRNLSEHYKNKGTIVSDILTEPHLEKYWWRGIPKNLGQAIFIGKDYLPLWNKIYKIGEMLGQGYFVSTEDWRSGENITVVTGSVPEEITEVDPPTKYDENGYKIDDNTIYYPILFPFSETAR